MPKKAVSLLTKRQTHLKSFSLNSFDAVHVTLWSGVRSEANSAINVASISLWLKRGLAKFSLNSACAEIFGSSIITPYCSSLAKGFYYKLAGHPGRFINSVA